MGPTVGQRKTVVDCFGLVLFYFIFKVWKKKKRKKEKRKRKRMKIRMKIYYFGVILMCYGHRPIAHMIFIFVVVYVCTVIRTGVWHML